MWQFDAGTQETGFSSNFADPKNVVTKSITWNGEAKDFELFDFRKKIAVVLQDVFLFSDSVLNNITLKDPTISKEEVEKAAKQIGIHDFIMTLPGGYDYNVKERGAMLSSGQRQLIAFLRAYVSKPSILILDEATSSVDSQAEEMIQYATETITKDRTSIVIAHRLATIKQADKIIVMDKGFIVVEKVSLLLRTPACLCLLNLLGI